MKTLLLTIFTSFIFSPAVFSEGETKEEASEMVLIEGATYQRGEDRKVGSAVSYPEEAPVHEVTVSSFLIDATEVTNAEFQKFVDATGYETFAERGLSREDFPNAPADQLKAGALVFVSPDMTSGKWHTGAEWQWWRFVEGANWQHPTGPGSSLEGKADHPVVCVNREDAEAYAKWAKKRLPTEAEWELAARGGLKRAFFVWGNQAKPDDDKWPANTFQGTFPEKNTAADGFEGTAPVASYAPNAFGLYDMAGNVWEICSDLYRPDYYSIFVKDSHPDPKGPAAELAISSTQKDFFSRGQPIPKIFEAPHPLARLWVTRGGSFLCHHTYCLRFRPAARSYLESLTPTNHTGFRCARDVEDDSESAQAAE